jgi:hypothetical protein
VALWITFDEFLNEIDEVDAELTDADRQKLQRAFDAAVSFVERVHKGRYNFTGEIGSTLKPVPDTLPMGLLMYSRRLDTRRRSPNGLISLGELGSTRVPSFDPDEQRLLRLGKHAIPRVG